MNTLLYRKYLSRSNKNTKCGWCLKSRVVFKKSGGSGDGSFMRDISVQTFYVYCNYVHMGRERCSFKGVQHIQCGCSRLARYAEAMCVDPNMHEMIGLIFSGALWILGRKYIGHGCPYQWLDHLNSYLNILGNATSWILSQGAIGLPVS